VRYVLRERFWHLGEDMDVTDENGNPVFHVDGKMFSLSGLLVMTDPRGSEIARVQRKLLSLLPTYEISIAGHSAAEVKKKFFTPFHDEFHIDVPGEGDLELVGNFLEHDFTIGRSGQTVASVSRTWVSLTATYGVDIAPGQNDALLLACVLALDLAEDRERHGGTGLFAMSN